MSKTNGFEHCWNHHIISTLDSFEFSDILFCFGSTWYLKYRDKQEEKEEKEKEGGGAEGEEDKEEE